MFKSFSMELAGRTLTVEVGRVAKQANGAAFMHYGDTVVLSTATASDKPRDGIDFFPLSVEYEEKLYSVGKIPGGFTKREGKASENATLTSRVIDRPMRPLFPKDYRNDVTLDNIVMSVDPDCSPELTAMLGSAIATCISDIPFDGPCAMTQVGLIDGEFIINPTSAQKKVSDLALTVASTREKVIMIEAGAKEVPEQTMIDAIFKAHEVNQEIIKFIDRIVAECGKEKHTYESCAIPDELFAAIKEIVPPAEMEEAVFTDEKQKREENIRQITERLEEAFAENEEWLPLIGQAVYQYQKKTVRKMILKDHKRPDGRRIDEIRPCCRCLNCLGGLCRVNPCNNSVFTDAMPEGYEVRPADGDKNVMVIGGGPAGMEAARVAAERGYAVTLYEKNGLGGLLDFAEMVKGKHESLGRLRNYLSRMLEVEGVNVVTGQEVDAAFVREQSPDVVIVATGGVRPELAAAGTAATPVIGVTDFLASEVGERVAVLGFNAQATDTAHCLIAQGKKVTVIAPEPAEAFGTGQAMMLNAFVKPAFFAAGGRLMPECTLKSVGDGEIVVTNSFGMDVALACDCVVDASTMSPNTALADELSGEFDVHVIGDAAEPLSIQNAITTGNLTARNC